MKKVLCLICSVCLMLCMLPVFSASAATVTPNGAVNIEFNATDWTGDTAQITNGNFYAKFDAGTDSITSVNTYNLGESFSVTSYFNLMQSTQNHSGSYSSMTIGDIELREYDTASTAPYTVKLYISGNEMGSYELGYYADTTTTGQKANHYFTVAKYGDTYKVIIDGRITAITATASGLDFSAVNITFMLTRNWSTDRYIKNCVINPNYKDIPTTDKLYPESGTILDSTNPNSAIGYLGNEVIIPTGENNDVVEYNYDGIYFESDIWQAVPMLSQEMIDRGIIEGGEACQAESALVTSSDGTLSFLGTDCGGLWRSVDGGNHWALAMLGLTADGGTGIAIDPMNKDHVIIVGCNTGSRATNGLFVTYNAYGQCEWEKVLGPTEISGSTVAIQTHSDFRIQIMYDTASYDEALGYCTTAYWSVESNVIIQGDVEYPQAAMWKTTDGGNSWQRLETIYGDVFVDGVAQGSSAFLAGAEVDSVSHNGTTYLYAATSTGFYISTDGGENWSKRNIIANAIDTVIGAVNGYAEGYEGYIWATNDDVMYISYDFGNTWTAKASVNYPKRTDVTYNDVTTTSIPDNISVSSLNPNNIYITWRQTNGYGYYSNDGGVTWFASNQNKNEAWQPVTGVSPFGYWSNIHEDSLYVIANGVWKSIDGGKNIRWNNSGYNAILVGGKWNFNVNNPNLVSFSSQDYNGGFSTDGGKTWTYLEWKGRNWGGFTYGSYMLTENDIIACDADSWGGVRYLWTTHDGGQTFQNTNITVEGSEVAIGALGKDNIAFMGEWRTDDYGYTWSKMEYNSTLGSTGCDGVYTIDPVNGTLFGKKDSKIVYSTDDGLTWNQLFSVGSSGGDIAYDHEAGILYTVSNHQLLSCKVDFSRNDNTFKVINYQSGSMTPSTVAVDPNNPNVVYVGESYWAKPYSQSGVYRSLDRGETWTLLTRTKGDGRNDSPVGALSALSINVNPATSELIATTSCMGVWKIDGPAQWYLDENIELETLTPDEPAKSGLTNQMIEDIIYASQYTNPVAGDWKLVELELVDANAAVEDGYLKVPDGVTIYTGDHIKLACHYVTSVTYPNGSIVANGFINLTSVKDDWSYNKQVCSGHSDYFSFDEPGIYSLYTIGNGSYSVITFEVYDPNAGIIQISNEAELAAIADNPNSNYVLTSDIIVSDWTTIPQFNGLIYGNGYTISGLNAPLFGINNGSIVNLNVDGDVSGSAVGIVANSNTSYIGHAMVSGSASGDGSGALCGDNTGIIEQSIVTASGAAVGSTSGTITDTYYNAANSAIANGSLGADDTVYSYTDITDSTQFGNLDSSWKLNESGPAIKINKSYGMSNLIAALGDYFVNNKFVHLENKKVTVDSIVSLYEADMNVSITSANGTAKDNAAKLVSGDTLTMTSDNTTYTLTFVIKGDVNLNGRSNATGLVIMKGIVLDTVLASNIVKHAADVDLDTYVNSVDVLTYRQALIGINQMW